MRPIDADAITYCAYDLDDYHFFRAVDEEAIAEMPTLTLDDLRPKGRWVNKNGRCGCSECRQGIRSTFEGLEMWLDMSTLPFCPFCGADMRRSANSANLEEDGTEPYGIEDIGVGENPGEPGVEGSLGGGEDG